MRNCQLFSVKPPAEKLYNLRSKATFPMFIDMLTVNCIDYEGYKEMGLPIGNPRHLLNVFELLRG